MVSIRTAALLVGVDHSPGLKPLRNAQNDAIALAQFLAGPRGPVALKDVHLAVGRQATRAWVARVAAALAQDPPDVLFVVFSGHGSQEAIALSDGLLSHRALAAVIGRIGASRVAVVIDACHAGAYARQHGYATIEGLPDATWQELLARALPGVRLLLAARPQESASDGRRRNGAFTHGLLRALQELPASMWLGDQHFISAEAAFQHAAHLVAAETNGTQRPLAFGPVADFPIARPAVAPTARVRRVAVAPPKRATGADVLGGLALFGLGMFIASRVLK